LGLLRLKKAGVYKYRRVGVKSVEVGGVLELKEVRIDKVKKGRDMYYKCQRVGGVRAGIGKVKDGLR
jgi:hypothetical protein